MLIDTWKRKAEQLTREIHAVYLAMKDPRTPWYARVLAAIIVGYALSPIDLIPDPIPILGYLDDLVLLPLGIVLLVKIIPSDILVECRSRIAATAAGRKQKNWIAGSIVIAIWAGLFFLTARYSLRAFQSEAGIVLMKGIADAGYQNLKVIAFFILSLPLLSLSWRTLFNLNNHGLYRFVVWESILWLTIHNFRYLIVEKFDLQQIISSVLMIASLLFVLSAVTVFRKKGRVSDQRSDDTLYDFEKTTVLVESGIYKHIRHPMYSSLIFLAWGILLRNIEVTSIIVASIATCSGVVAAWIEEKENIRYFGEKYRRYALKTRRFVPFVI